MYKRTTAALMLVGGLIGTSAFSQTAPNPTQQTVTTQTPSGPVFRVTVVGRSTRAINFRPRSGDTKINFTGTTLSPRARGDATIRGRDGYIEIDANFESLESPRK